MRKVESRSVSRVLSRTVIPLRRTSLHAFSNLPGSSAGHANGTLFGLAPSGVCLATNCYQSRGALLPHLFTLTGAEALRRLFSVALSVGSRLPGVTWHSALWSPDFPPPKRVNTIEKRSPNRLGARLRSGAVQSKQCMTHSLYRSIRHDPVSSPTGSHTAASYAGRCSLPLPPRPV